LGGSLSYGGTSQGAINAGTGYTIVPSGLTSSNYTISYANGALDITKANATVTANSSTSTYNGANQTVSGFTASGLVGSETAAVLTGISASRTEKNAGTYAVTASGTDTNYNLTFVDGTLTINPAALTVTANNASKTYDGVAYSGGNGVSYSGLVGGESASVLGGSLSYGGTSQGAINAGTGYTIVPSGLTSSNYTISYANGALTINPAAVTVTTINGALQGAVNKVYDGTNTATLVSANYILTGWLGSDGATVTKTSGVYDTANAGSGKTVTVFLSASDYTATGATNLSNYSLPSSISGAVGTITEAAALPIPPSLLPTVKTVPEVMAKSTVNEAVRSTSYPWPPGNTMTVPEKSEAGLLAVTFLHASDAPPTASAVAFEQDAEKISVKTAAMPLVRPVVDKVVASGKLSEFMVANANGNLVEFMGSMVNGRLVIVAPSVDAKQLAKSDANVVLVAAVLALGKGAPIMLAKLDSVVFDLR
ncbi:MAG: hypothetical protein RLZZ464_297, partial [Pseudomonadota bacterium]